MQGPNSPAELALAVTKPGEPSMTTTGGDSEDARMKRVVGSMLFPGLRAPERIGRYRLLEHLDDPKAAMKELARVSSRWILVTVPYCIDIEKTLCPHCGNDYFLYGHQHSFGKDGINELAAAAGARVERFEHLIPLFECRRYKWFPPLKWLVWSHFKNTGTLGALIRVG